MKKQLFSLILAGFFLITAFAIAQNSNLPIKKIKGIEYYVYSVEASEGLYAIGRKFEVSPEEITKANPEIKDGLNIGQKILIPIHKKKLEKKEVDKKSSQEFVQHKVAKRQTLFGISRKYDVSQEDIKKYNPQIENGLHDGMILQIPVLENEKKKSKEEKALSKKLESQSEKYITHIVKANETLYSISKLYKVDIENVIALNPGSEKTISIGSSLKIPAQLNGANSKKPKDDDVRKSSGTSGSLPNTTEPLISTENRKPIRIAFLLPFMLEQLKNDAGADRFANFYAGSLLAIKEAKQKGISMEIFTYDTDKTEEKFLEVLNNPELKSMDFIIGPAFSNQVSVMGDFAKTNGINTLIPFTSKVFDIDNNPYLYQFNPGTESELNFATELFTGKYKNMNLIFADIPDISMFDDGKTWSEMLRKNLTVSKRTFSTFELTSLDFADFSSVLKKGSKNLIIFNTDKFAYITPFLGSLKNYTSSFDITLFEQYTWKDQPDNLSQSMHISPFISTFNQSGLAKFNKDFSTSFNWNSSSETPRYDLLGYDLTNYFVALLNQYGNKFPVKMNSKVNASFIQSQPRFERTSPKSGFINQQLYLTEDKNK